jgi:hypothetical protein
MIKKISQKEYDEKYAPKEKDTLTVQKLLSAKVQGTSKTVLEVLQITMTQRNKPKIDAFKEDLR